MTSSSGSHWSPWQVSLAVSLLSISVFLIRLSWIIRGFIYFNRHLLDSWKEKLVTTKQELNIIWLISHFRRVSTSWREILSQLQKFVWGLYVLPFRKRLSVVNNMNFLLRHSENISFCYICWHFLYWGCGWVNGLLHFCARSFESFSWRTVHLLTYSFIGVPRGARTVGRVRFLLFVDWIHFSALCQAYRAHYSIMTVTRPCLQGKYNLT